MSNNHVQSAKAIAGRRALRGSGFVDHPGGKTLQEVFEAFHVLRRELVFHIGAFECFLETTEPNLASPLVDLKGKMPGPHAWRAVPFRVEGWPSQNSHEKCSRLFRCVVHVGWEKASDLGLLEFLIKIRHHLEDVAFAHDSIDFAVGAGPLRRPPGRRMNDPFHLSLILTKVKRISIPLRFAFLFNPDGRYRYY